MYIFLFPLLLGFVLNSASTFTTFYSRHFGERAGRLICTILRDVVGIPVWAVGYAMAAMASSNDLFNPGLISSLFAWLLIIAGGVIICAGLWSLRWRAAAPSLKDTLVVNGLYAHIRHPLYTGMLLELCGLFLWIPTSPVLVACILGVIWAVGQARLEELDLTQRLPAYKEYMKRVPAFVPKLKLG